ncbi:transglutaminase-like domain-containing protein [Demequina mangrovi]|uniref:Transglutaminase-like superfamily protein n=1 Tax=Demequina mangrovi TaxID=1043493 RepID=A0A1H7ALY7_9MICO|nr:transglutaminase-like domain-containing protein [Demequina mangrovi]SEJ65926.1 Transglutaminase-like superfamily protein [Demequina mangrovi]
MTRGERVRRPAVPATVVLGACAYAAAIAATIIFTLRPVFVGEGTIGARYGLVMLVGLGVGMIASLVPVLARRGPVAALVLLGGGYLAAALLVAIPGALRGPEQLARALVEALRAPVTGWKDIVTLPTPLGEYEATLAVPLVLVAATVAGIVWAGTRERWWGIAAAIGGAGFATAVAVGPAARTGLDALPGLASGLSREILLGLAAWGASLGWILWRMAQQRRAALRGAGGGVRGVRAPGRALGRFGLGATVLAVALLAAVSVAVPVAQSQPRDVARTSVTPRLVVDSSVSPLSTYRSFFAGELHDAPLFTVSEVSGPVSRIRIATLPFFDGSAFTAVASQGYTPLRFQRVPSDLSLGGAERVSLTVTVEGLEGPWAPLPGALGGATFGGPRAGSLADAFYYAPEAASAVIALDGGVAAGDTLTVAAAAAQETPLAEAGPSPGGAAVAPDLIPDSLSEWVESQEVTRDGAGLAELVERLRSRGYLSHALTAEGTPQWIAALGEYTFEPSAAGHSYDRIDRLFTALLEREGEAGENASDVALVAAVGDDEQFAVAVALMAADLGFPSRVVVGVRLADTDALGWVPDACADVCRGHHLSAWTEVRAGSGEWIAVDVTPQHSSPVSPSVATEADPEIPTATDPDRAEPVDAVAALKGRSGGGEVAPALEAHESWFTGRIRTAVVTAIIVLLLLGPLLGVLVAKAVRRRRRRRAAPTAAAEGGWDEYVDLGVDAGLAPMPLATRREIAEAYGTTHGATLAAVADRATFTVEGVEQDDARQVWELLALDRAELRARQGVWRRLATRLSTRSLLGRGSTVRDDAAHEREQADERWRTVPSRAGSSSTRRRR